MQLPKVRLLLEMLEEPAPDQNTTGPTDGPLEYVMNYRGRVGRFGRFGDVTVPAVPGSALLPPSPVVMPSAMPQASSAPLGPGGYPMAPPNTLPLSQSDDFFDPMRDGEDIMFYVTNFTATLNAGAQTNTQIQIDSGVDFYWFASTYQADLAGAAQLESTTVVPLITMLINDTGSRKNLMNSAIPIAELAGPGERPYRLVRPRLFRASSTINFTWTNYSSGTNYANIYLALHGYTKNRGT